MSKHDEEVIKVKREIEQLSSEQSKLIFSRDYTKHTEVELLTLNTQISDLEYQIKYRNEVLARLNSKGWDS